MWGDITQTSASYFFEDFSKSTVIDSLQSMKSIKLGFKEANKAYMDQIKDKQWIDMLSMHPLNFFLIKRFSIK